jgi:regulator of CtrA degradation
MSFGNKTSGGGENGQGHSPFGGSALFQRTYREGMALVEEAATYLDGPGREQAKDLPRSTALAYATESMRLTTRLMQVAAWLLVQKAVNEGDMSESEALGEKYELGGSSLAKSRKIDGTEQLPDALKELIVRSENIYRRIERLDGQMRSGEEPEQSSLSEQQDRAEAFFREALSPRTTRH